MQQDGLQLLGADAAERPRFKQLRLLCKSCGAQLALQDRHPPVGIHGRATASLHCLVQRCESTASFKALKSAGGLPLQHSFDFRRLRGLLMVF